MSGVDLRRFVVVIEDTDTIRFDEILESISAGLAEAFGDSATDEFRFRIAPKGGIIIKKYAVQHGYRARRIA